jgi:coatomer subunit beta'
MQRVWSISALPGTNSVGIGYDDGSVILKLGREEPAISMDQSGKIIWAKQNEILTANLKTAAEGENDFRDGERVILSQKELGSCDIYPQSLVHSPNGRY